MNAGERPRRRPRRFARRLVGVLVLLLLVELSMQLAAPLVQRSMLDRGDGPVDPDTSLSILCVGDSNTFGLNVPRAWAYPAQLASLLRARFAAPPAVTNRGVPGQNAAQLARDLTRDLADTDADLALILVGLNDTWNTGAEQSGLAGLVGRLKLVRLVRVLASGVTTAKPFEVVSDERGEFSVRRGDEARRVNLGEDDGTVRSGAELEQNLRRWIGRAVDTCRDHGTLPVLLTYPEFQGFHGEVNAVVRALAAEQDVLLVDLERRFAEHFARESYELLMFNDHHPNVRGYQLAAADVAAALETAGLVPPATDGPDAGGPVALERPPAVLAEPGGRLALTGPPGFAFQVAVGRPAPDGGGFSVGPVTLPLMDDELLAMSRLQPDLSGWLGDDGTAAVVVSPLIREGAHGTSVSACLLLLNDPSSGATEAVAAASPAVSVDFSP